MVLINSFNYNFTTNISQQQVQQIRTKSSNNLKSFSKNFISGVKIKSNVQKKNNTPAVVIKKSV